MNSHPVSGDVYNKFPRVLPRTWGSFRFWNRTLLLKFAGLTLIPFNLVAPTSATSSGAINSNIGIDAALAFLVPQAMYAEYANKIHNSGFRLVRDRFSWARTQPSADQYTWQELDDLLAAYAKVEIQPVLAFHDVPSWLRSAPSSFPDDLRPVFDFGKTFANRYHGAIRAVEVWNEPDNSLFGSVPPDKYAGFLKAFCLGVRSADTSVQCYSAGVAYPADRFSALMLANGVGSYVDKLAYHFYSPQESFSTAQYKVGQLKRIFGVENRPDVITEFGITSLHLRFGKDALTADQEAQRAEFVLKQYISAMFKNVDAYYFVFPSYRSRDGKVPFGLLTSDLAGTPTLSALKGFLHTVQHLRPLDHHASPDTYWYLFDKLDTGEVVAAAASNSRSTIRLDGYSWNSLFSATLDGERHLLTSKPGQVELPLSPKLSFFVFRPTVRPAAPPRIHELPPPVATVVTAPHVVTLDTSTLDAAFGCPVNGVPTCYVTPRDDHDLQLIVFDFSGHPNSPELTAKSQGSCDVRITGKTTLSADRISRIPVHVAWRRGSASEEHECRIRFNTTSNILISGSDLAVTFVWRKGPPKND